ncbi:MAG: MFS transporter [Lachnospiraceae bacterium]|nr:MFS transporter [Lachnospiraceae bacterium]
MIKSKKDCLWLIFFLIIFINGFEAGGYQASLLDIGKSYDLSTTSKGIFASVELFATMLAPIFLGALADKNSKIKSLRILLLIQTIASLFIIFFNSKNIFVVGVFFLGLTTSALQFITIAALADIYPKSFKKKIGFLTSMYALGAFVAPLFVSSYLKMGFDFKTLFILLTVASIISFSGLLKANDEKREEAENETASENTGSFILKGILLLCVIMCIYVGYENGFAFFIDSLFEEELASSLGKYALSIFWIIMIPSRVMVAYLGKYSKRILTLSIIAIPLITLVISSLKSDILVILLCIPLGFACGAIYPCVLDMVIPLSGDKKATATGMITTATGIGGVVFTALTGIAGDMLGLRSAIILLSSFFIISLLSVFLLKYVTNDQKEGTADEYDR